MIRIGINGFGRIGRTAARILAARPDMQLAAINDVAEDVENLAYLYTYDSTFGRAENPAEVVDLPKGRAMRIGGDLASVHCFRDIAEVPWRDSGVDVVIDASGVRHNVLSAHRLVDSGDVRKVIVTHSPSEGIDRHIIMGLNHDIYDPARDHVLSSSICDANAIGHVLEALDHDFGVEGGFVTTLHPWLSYQNLVYAPLPSQSDPGHFWKDYSLGRASTDTIIPKNTTAITALQPILPDIARRVQGFSYRVPTHVVTTADLSLMLRRGVEPVDLCRCLEDLCRRSRVVRMNRQPLVSVDYEREEASAVIDMQWLKVNGPMVKVVLWYDNEWGYCSRVVDLARLVAPKAGERR